MVALEEVWEKIRDLAEPLEPIEVSLGEAVGLVLSEPVHADVDLPPFDRAAAEGYAVRASEAQLGAFLRVISPPDDSEPDYEYELDAGESARVDRGAPLPVGADSVLAVGQVRSDCGSSGPRVVEVIEPVGQRRHVAERGVLLRSGATLLPAGTRLTPTMVALLASQGCIHPLCHRRVRVSILAIGDHLVGPGEAPILYRERNAANLAVSALIQAAGGMVQDIGCVSEADADLALDRATNAPFVLILGEATGGMLRRLARDGVEPIVSGLDFDPGESIQYGLMRDEQGFPVAHLLHLPLDPVAAVIGTALLALPLLARLQGGDELGPVRLKASWQGEPPAEPTRTTALPAILSHTEDGRLVARAVELRGHGDLPGLASANAVALLQPGNNPLVEVVPLGPIEPQV